ncbi:MAG: hypothetical protein N2257_03290 [Thermodesulfovibrionales bacterium]|nr:hypothetical protein [Thermodesulfovibrionales bacterium]
MELAIHFRPYLQRISEIINKSENITLKVSSLRILARDFVRRFIQNLVANVDLDELNNISESEDIKDNLFLKKLDGNLIRYDSVKREVLISTTCPFVHFFEEIRDDTFLKEYEKSFKREGIMHPLCIVHQIIREELFSRIRKGPLFTLLYSSAQGIFSQEPLLSKKEN